MQNGTAVRMILLFLSWQTNGTWSSVLCSCQLERFATRKHYFREQAGQCAVPERPYSSNSLEELVLHCLVCISFGKLVLQISCKKRKFAFFSTFTLLNELSKRFSCWSVMFRTRTPLRPLVQCFGEYVLDSLVKI